jgi:hypothetical protein
MAFHTLNCKTRKKVSKSVGSKGDMDELLDDADDSRVKRVSAAGYSLAWRKRPRPPPGVRAVPNGGRVKG